MAIFLFVKSFHPFHIYVYYMSIHLPKTYLLVYVIMRPRCSLSRSSCRRTPDTFHNPGQILYLHRLIPSSPTLASKKPSEPEGDVTTTPPICTCSRRFGKPPLFGELVVGLSQQPLLLLLLLAGTKWLKATVLLAEQLPCSSLADSEPLLPVLVPQHRRFLLFHLLFV